MRPTLNVLSDELIKKVLDEAKRIMAETGMEIRGEKLRQRLLDHGLKTDQTGKRVLFSADVVEAAIESAPKSFTLYNRDGEPHAEIGGNNVHYVPGSSGLKVLDFAMAWNTLPILQQHFRPMLTSSRKFPMCGAFT